MAACLGLPAGVASNGVIVFQPQILALGATVAILSAAIPYSLEMAALTRNPAGAAGILLSLEPVVAAPAGLLVLDEALSGSRWFGIACICGATTVAISSTGPAGNAGSPASAPGARGAAAGRPSEVCPPIGDGRCRATRMSDEDRPAPGPDVRCLTLRGSCGRFVACWR
ncbi:EamA family transporter [Nocardia rhamnosiphila]